MTIFKDDRTEAQKLTHGVIVLMTDAFMSGWGESEGMKSYAGWACRPEDVNSVERWVRSRHNARRVRIVDGSYRPKGNVHCHIYVAKDTAP